MKLNKIVLLVALAIFSFSCEYDKLDTYSSQDRIYFEYALTESSTLSDSIIVNFAYDEIIKTDTIIQVPIKALGNTSDNDRFVDFTFMETASTAILGQHIQLLSPGIIPAGKTNGFLSVKLINTEELKEKMLKARIRLVPNEYFQTDFSSTVSEKLKKDSREFSFYFTNFGQMPNLWAHPQVGFYLTRIFGTYSNRKFDIMCEACGFDRDYFTYDPQIESALDVYYERMPSDLTFAWIRMTNQYLTEYKKINNKPATDEYGFEITIPLPYE